MSDEKAVAWLRQVIEGDKVVAEQMAAGTAHGYPQRMERWDGLITGAGQEGIARCEAELAILDLCERVIREDEGHEYYSDGWAGLGVARFNLSAVASGYRHREGYAEHWGTP